ncbi:5'-nucleotidase C-terminal domain-containing protein [Seohaeicola zhoushanensis]
MACGDGGAAPGLGGGGGRPRAGIAGGRGPRPRRGADGAAGGAGGGTPAQLFHLHRPGPGAGAGRRRAGRRAAPAAGGVARGRAAIALGRRAGAVRGRSGPLAYADIPAGPVALRHLVELQPFPNDLHAVVVTGAQLGDWIEHSAGLFNRIVPGADPVALIDPGLPGHDFDVIHGVACEIDLSVPSRFLSDGSLRQGGARRARRLTYAGRAVMPDQRFVVAVNSYRSSGGGNVAALRGAERLDLPGTGLRAALAGYLGGAAHDPLEQAPPPWGFVPLPGARAWLQTGPGAQGHLGELAGRGVEAAGIDGEGFLRLILPL